MIKTPHIKTLLILVTCLFSAGKTFCQLPVVHAGVLMRHANFPSKYVTPRHIDVWLPPGYDKTKKYPVIYMNDGQMLFDSSITWNKKEWGIDEEAGQLIEKGSIRPFIAVGIWNGGAARHREYFPQKPFKNLSASQQHELISASRTDGSPVFSGDSILSDAYLRFLAEELIPFIQKNYPVSRKRQNTFILGSSMGALISLYAVCEYPRIFGGVACLSTHWPGIFSKENNPFPASLFRYLEKATPSPAQHKIYFDRGTATLDSLYGDYQDTADALFKKKGYADSSYQSKIFQGEPHDENAWRKRIEVPLRFLLEK